jgi:hypothetical protein
MVRRTRRSAHSVELAPRATPAVNQKVLLGITVQLRPLPLRRWSDPVRRRRMPPAAPARTANTFTTGLANAR